MNAKSHPIQVVNEWHRIAESIKQQINDSAIKFEIKAHKHFGLKITYKEFRKIYFEISDYEVVQGFMNKMKVLYVVEQVPEDKFTPIDQSLQEARNLHDYEVTSAFKEWIDLIKSFIRLDSIDFTSLFFLEDDELFLQNEPNRYFEENNILDHCLKSLSVSNFQGIKRATIENLPVDTHWVFLVGENGFGKSTVLQSILLGLHGSKDGPYDFDQEENSRIRVEYKSHEDNLINDFRTNPSPLTHIAAYGPVRLNMQSNSSISEISEKQGTLYSLFRTDGDLLNVEFELVKWALKGDKRFQLVRTAFCRLVPYLADIQLNKDTDRIEYIEKDVFNENARYEPLTFEKIASGFRSIVGIAGDMIIRLSNTQKDILDPSDLTGIVIIDELDLHWHPKLQKQIPELFSEVFPKIQFIVSTHSPIPLLGAPKNSTILKVTRTKEEGITIQKVDVDLKTLTPNLLLTSGIFDMDNIFSSQIEELTEVRTEDTFEEMEKNEAIDEFLKEFESSNEQFPDELFEPKTNG
ncbi:AAA family ATPase [Dyadobacter sp. Leaf189]|uniref:AAA family ATPase n=1 Tax=Dyadobacter sp. Leaf189 TaxID=1736295 RepID=UPI0006FB2E74|nr:AAA family ATPase [Dyadobacter sp. Leaf189]KQS34102.1 hypothetical protein ASG33_08805 [Dyadobacter sp. Leaf189]